jgi:hypothetical protein
LVKLPQNLSPWLSHYYPHFGEWKWIPVETCKMGGSWDTNKKQEACPNVPFYSVKWLFQVPSVYFNGDVKLCYMFCKLNCSFCCIFFAFKMFFLAIVMWFWEVPFFPLHVVSLAFDLEMWRVSVKTTARVRARKTVTDFSLEETQKKRF